MSKAVMISIQPRWCELIARKLKNVEIRKTRPKLEPPFKCYIYCTKKDNMGLLDPTPLLILNERVCNSKVIGEFVCNFIYEFTEENQEFCGASFDAMQITPKELSDYANGKTVYGWHISDLVIYDRPKELSEFYRECPGIDDVGLCYECEKAVGDEFDCGVHRELHLSRPPQSWCYVEEA